MSQAPSPFQTTPATPAPGRRNRRRRLRQIVQAEAATAPEPVRAPSQRSMGPRRSRRFPLLTFAVGMGMGFVIGQSHALSLPLGAALPLGSGMALLQQAQQRIGALLHPLGFAQKPVLVMGSDVVGGNTDVMFAVQVGNGVTRITQVPRDTYVQMPSEGVMKANSLYGILGPAVATKTVSGLMDLPIDRYLKVNLQAVSRVADALGGVEVDVPKRMVYADNSQGLYIDLYPGPQTLKGEALEGFLRFRHDEAGDLGRMERQRLVLNQVFRKLAQPATLARLPALLQIAGEDIHTNLSPLEITQLMGAMARTRLSTSRLPGHEYWENDLSYWMPEPITHHSASNGVNPAP